MNFQTTIRIAVIALQNFYRCLMDANLSSYRIEKAQSRIPYGGKASDGHSVIYGFGSRTELDANHHKVNIVATLYQKRDDLSRDLNAACKRMDQLDAQIRASEDSESLERLYCLYETRMLELDEELMRLQQHIEKLSKEENKESKARKRRCYKLLASLAEKLYYEYKDKSCLCMDKYNDMFKEDKQVAEKHWQDASVYKNKMSMYNDLEHEYAWKGGMV